jgi:hypothetical protein
MSLTCEPNKPTPSYLVRRLQQIKRDIGLSPIFNVSTKVTPCIENFVSPTYPCDGNVCKAVTGLTIGCPSGYTLTSGGTVCMSGVTSADTITVNPSCLHNLSEVSSFDITFDFSSGNTMYTGYTGQFCYSVSNTLPAAIILPVCTSYSGITGNSLTRTFTINSDISSVDNEYTVRSWNKFTSKCMTNNLGNTGITIDTSPYINVDNNCYFVTTVNPPAPLLQYINAPLFQNISFVNESLGNLITTNSDGGDIIENSNVFQLRNKPVGGIVVISINGITVDKRQYTVNQTTRVVTFVGVTLESTDVIQAYYNKSPLTDDSLTKLDDVVKLEVFSVTGITTGVTSSATATTYTNIVNYNVDNDRNEIFLTEKMDPNIGPIITINGVNMVYNIDFFRSNFVDNKLIMGENIIIKAGDIISVYYYYTGYNNAGDLGTLRINKPTIQWSTNQNIMKTLLSNGMFTVEIADRNDPTYSNILKTNTTLYNNTLSNYTLEVGPITTTSVKNYIYRVKFTKNYVTQRAVNSYQTETYSKSGSFSLNWDFINNTNF